jgi:hypothetical protein
MGVEQEVEIEILGIDAPDSEDFEDYGTVTVYNRDMNAYVPGFNKTQIPVEEVGIWMENI